MITNRESASIDRATSLHRGRVRHTTVGGKSGKGKYLHQTFTQTENEFTPLPRSDRSTSKFGYYVKRCLKKGKPEYSWALIYGPNHRKSWQPTPPPVPYASVAQAESMATQLRGYTEIAY
jgi:hypothetical protein